MKESCSSRKAWAAMAFPDAAANEPESFEALLTTIDYVPAEEAPDFLRAEIAQRVAALSSFVASAPDAQTLDEQLTEIDIDRVIYLIGTARPALQMIAAAIVELSVTIPTIEEVVRWMDVRPVALNPTQAHIGIDIAYIVAFRTLTQPQRWLLHSIAWWAPPPATVSRAHAVSVANGSSAILQVTVTEIEMERLLALAFVVPVILETADAGVTPSPVIRERLTIAPYIRYIAQSGLESWSLPENTPEELASISALQVASFALVEWAVTYAGVIAGPTVAPTSDDSEADDDDDAPQLTPEPSLEALTDAELWTALEPEMPHVLRAASLAYELGLSDRIYVLCQWLTPRLRQRTDPPTLGFRRSLLEVGLIAARAASVDKETLVLATQLADVALDERDLERAESFANEALNAALAVKDMRAIGFATRRLAAITIRRGDAEKARTVARQAVALARANGNEHELAESITLLDAATRMRLEDTDD